MQLQVRIDDRDLQRALSNLGPRMGGVLAKSLNRTAFEMLEGERAGVTQSFDFAGASTRAFMAGRGSFRFDAATAAKLEVRMHPAPKNESLLREHVEGATIRPDDRRLRVGQRFAIPVTVKRGGRGKVPLSKTPARVLTVGRGFVAGDAVLERTGRKGRGAVRVLYALASSVTLPERFDFYGIARKTAATQFPIKAREELAKLSRV